MAQIYIFPVAMEYKSKLFNQMNGNNSGPQHEFYIKTNNLVNSLVSGIEELMHTLAVADKFHEEQLHDKATFFYKEIVNGQMKKLRHVCDELEKIVDNKMWPLPKYSEMLFLK